MRGKVLAIAGLVMAGCWLSPAGAHSATLTLETVNAAEFPALSAGKEKRRAALIKAQILLDRARISPGVIDGLEGENFTNAVAAFQEMHSIEPTGKLDEQTWTGLTKEDGEPVLTTYSLAKEDVDGPFLEDLPEKFEDLAGLDRLAFTGPEELLAEKFHMDLDLLRELNPEARFDRAGEEIVVASVESAKPADKAVRLLVDKTGKAVRVLGRNDRLVAFYPATIGSREKPAPTGEFEVRAIAQDPTYTYDPSFAFKGVKAEKPFEIAPGPNNPVGTVWIDLTADTYGIHGTPEPAKIGKTYSNGCVRLTNWDVEELAEIVGKGTPVVFPES